MTALYPLEGDVGLESRRRLIAAVKELRLLGQVERYQTGEENKSGDEFAQLTMRAVFAPALKHCATELDAEDVRHMVSTALKNLSRSSTITAPLVVFTVQLLKSSVVPVSDIEELRIAGRKRIGPMLELFREDDHLVAEAVGWFSENVVLKEDLRNISKAKMLDYLRYVHNNEHSIHPLS